jgi:hypothetical protein
VQVRLSAAELGARVGGVHEKPVAVESASALIDERIKELWDWRGKTLAKVPAIIHEAGKWLRSPVWSHDGIIVVGNAHKDKDKVKLTFSHGASLPDPDKLFRGPRRQRVASDRFF